MRKLIPVLLLFLFLALSACTTDNPVSNNNNGPDTPSATLPPLDLSVSESEAGLTGRVVSSVTDEPLANIEVWLAYVAWNEDRTGGAYYVDGSASPSTRTRADGRFLFNNLEARDYVIVVGDLYGQNVVMSNNDGSARIYPAVFGDVVDAGTLRVDLDVPPTFTPIDPYPDPAALEPTGESVPEAYP